MTALHTTVLDHDGLGACSGRSPADGSSALSTRTTASSWCSTTPTIGAGTS